jgi:hypothetical protein
MQRSFANIFRLFASAIPLVAFGGLAPFPSPIPKTLSSFFPTPTKGTVVGVWEGLLLQGQQVVHVELNATDPSYLSLAFGHSGEEKIFVYVLDSLSIEKGKVILHFSSRSPPADSITMTLKGWANASEGVLEGTFLIGKNTFPFHMRKGTWTRDFDALSRKAEEAIQKERQKALPTPEVSP